MANSFTKVTLGAAQTVGFTTPTYIVSSHLTVSVNNVTVPAVQAGATQTVFGSFTSTNPLYYILVEGSTSLSFSEELPAGAVVLINRNSSQSTKLVSYSDSGLLTSDVLNEDSNQAFFIAQEALDQSASSFDSGFEASQSVTVTKVAGIEAGADVTDTANVVAALTAGTNIAIAADGTISSTDTNTTYTGGTGLTLSGTTFNVDAAQTGITSLGTLSGLTTGATTVNGALAVNNTTQSITDTTTNSTSVYGPTLELYRDGGDGNAASTVNMAQSDKLGTIDFYGNNDAGTPEKIKYAKIFSTIYEETDGAESGRLSFSVINAGTLTEGVNPATILDLEPDVAQFNSTVRLKAAASGGVQATSTPILELYQEDGPQADDGDHLGEIQFTALNNNNYSPIKHKYAGIHAEIIDESNATEDGSLHFTTVTAGTEDTTVLTLNGTESTFSSPVKVAVGPITINSDNTNADLVISNSEASSADASPIIKLSRSHGSSGGNDGDDIGKIQFFGANDRGLSSGGPEEIQYANIYGEIVDSTDGTEDGSIKFGVANNGSIEDPIFSVFNYGIVMGTDNDLRLGQRGEIWFEGASSNSNETRLNVVDPTAARTILLPDADGTLVIQPDNGGVQFPAQSAAPSAPANGQVYYDTDDHKLKLYANGAWVDLN